MATAVPHSFHLLTNWFVYLKDPNEIMMFAEEDFNMFGIHKRLQHSENEYVSMFCFSNGRLGWQIKNCVVLLFQHGSITEYVLA